MNKQNKIRKDYWMYPDHDEYLKLKGEEMQMSKSSFLAFVIRFYKDIYPILKK